MHISAVCWDHFTLFCICFYFLFIQYLFMLQKVQLLSAILKAIEAFSKLRLQTELMSLECQRESTREVIWPLSKQSEDICITFVPLMSFLMETWSWPWTRWCETRLQKDAELIDNVYLWPVLFFFLPFPSKGRQINNCVSILWLMVLSLGWGALSFLITATLCSTTHLSPIS